MLSKEKVRKKFHLIRKRKYFSVDKNYFKPLIHLINRKKKKNLSLYYPSNYEVDTIKLFEALGKISYLSTSLPVISNNGTMKFVEWKPSDPLQVNIYGFLEPIKQKKTISPDLFVVPLLAYDRFHNRLGYGKGYYDRFLKSLNSNTVKIGLSLFEPVEEIIDINNYDVSMDICVTPNSIYDFK